MVPNDIDILRQAASEIERAKKLIRSAASRLDDVINSGNPKTDYEVTDIKTAFANMRTAIVELDKIKLE